ncbi:MAG: hypothetical protein K6E47_11060 [Lachnospiraceae bacterium]|nr:hypothetical protein [Lachnospiraceae bacterium]
MDFLIEVLIGLADANFDSKNEYIIDVKKYPKPLVYLATVLYSLFLLAIIGGLFAVIFEVEGIDFDSYEVYA